MYVIKTNELHGLDLDVEINDCCTPIEVFLKIQWNARIWH